MQYAGDRLPAHIGSIEKKTGTPNSASQLANSVMPSHRVVDSEV